MCKKIETKNQIEKHFRNTERLIKLVSKNKIGEWLLNEGYYPEPYVLPPSFRVTNFKFNNNLYLDLNKLSRQNLVKIEYPKSLLTYRTFGIQHPYNYHDIVGSLLSEWDSVVEHLFHKDLKIFSYSFPIPVDYNKETQLSPLRSGRMIYEWITMAEKDLVIEAHKYKHIVRTDITNFYNSVYTHSIPWALHGVEDSFQDKDKCTLIGNKIDRLIQYANYGRTNGVPIGPVVSDLIAEIILGRVDLNVSKKLNRKDFIATRFKDDYRVLCHSEDDAKEILQVLADELNCYNLLINENKTKILNLPNGLYRQHNRAYFPNSLKKLRKITFQEFEYSLLKVLDIHKEFPGTSLIEKFLSELYTKDFVLKLTFSNNKVQKEKEIYKTYSLLILAKRESEKVLCHVLAIIELIYKSNKSELDLKTYTKEFVLLEIIQANEKQSVFELTWYLYFSRYMGLGITDIWFRENVLKELRDNLFLKSIFNSRQEFFKDSGVNLFTKPKDCRNTLLVNRLAVFNRTNNDFDS